MYFNGLSITPCWVLGGITSSQEWNWDSCMLKYLDDSIVTQAFLHHETHGLDKSGCLSFGGRKYDVSVSIAGRTVQITYDPMAPKTITVTCEGTAHITAHLLAIPEFCNRSPSVPANMQEMEPGRRPPSSLTPLRKRPG